MTFSRGRNIVTPDPADYQVRLDVSISSSDATPVSYTHLDVYKRQISMFVP